MNQSVNTNDPKPALCEHEKMSERMKRMTDAEMIERAERAAEVAFPSAGRDEPGPKSKAFADGYANALMTVRLWFL